MKYDLDKVAAILIPIAIIMCGLVFIIHFNRLRAEDAKIDNCVHDVNLLLNYTGVSMTDYEYDLQSCSDAKKYLYEIQPSLCKNDVYGNPIN